MKKIHLKRSVTIPAGVALMLTARQLLDRKNQVEKFDDDSHVGIEPMQFKAGEIIVVSGDLPKGIITDDWFADQSPAVEGDQGQAVEGDQGQAVETDQKLGSKK